MFLQIRNASFGYKEPLITNFDGCLNLGEICLLIGDNGVGKTTLVRSILNQIALLKGSIEIENKKIDTLSSKQLAEKIAVVFSKSTLPKNYTVFDLIALGKFIYYPYYFKLNPDDDKQISTIINQLELTKFKNTPLVNLSDGNLQKAFIGRALAQNSPIIILDEPTTHLDETNKIMVLKILRKLAVEHNKLILFSSHDWRLAKEFADMIWYIKDNKMQQGVAEDVLLNNKELTNVNLFNIQQSFVPPQIDAPKLLKELLYSFLQKNYQKDLSQMYFIWVDKKWQISYRNSTVTVSNFKDLQEIFANIYEITKN